ncbi:MAG: hypothetical protein KJO07_02985, partial [Deltaproteobacteria bacterium]|nr:hypothetical protein [Deltaproteobacteria bacterium]
RHKLETDRAVVADHRHEAGRDQKRREDEIAGVEAKHAEITTKLYDGSVTSPKDAQAMQEELEALKRHQEHLEDGVLEVMERIEPLDAALAEIDKKLEAIATRIEQSTASLAEQETAIDAQIAAVEAERAAAVAVIDPDHLARYERLRAGFGGTSVVQFDGKNCAGCPMMMPAMEIDRMKKAQPASLLDCSECGRLVVT